MAALLWIMYYSLLQLLFNHMVLGLATRTPPPNKQKTIRLESFFMVKANKNRDHTLSVAGSCEAQLLRYMCRCFSGMGLHALCSFNIPQLPQSCSFSLAASCSLEVAWARGQVQYVQHTANLICMFVLGHLFCFFSQKYISGCADGVKTISITWIYGHGGRNSKYVTPLWWVIEGLFSYYFPKCCNNSCYKDSIESIYACLLIRNTGE